MITLKEIHKRLVSIDERLIKKIAAGPSNEKDWTLVEDVFSLRNDVFDAAMEEIKEDLKREHDEILKR